MYKNLFYTVVVRLVYNFSFFFLLHHYWSCIEIETHREQIIFYWKNFVFCCQIIEINEISYLKLENGLKSRK